MAALKVRLVAIRAEVLPGSQLAKACDYARCPVALGRKNWLHIGDEKAGPKIAAIISVLATCRRRGIQPRDYLLAVLPKRGRPRPREVHRLTPLAWLRPRQPAPVTGT